MQVKWVLHYSFKWPSTQKWVHLNWCLFFALQAFETTLVCAKISKEDITLENTFMENCTSKNEANHLTASTLHEIPIKHVHRTLRPTANIEFGVELGIVYIAPLSILYVCVCWHLHVFQVQINASELLSNWYEALSNAFAFVQFVGRTISN